MYIKLNKLFFTITIIFTLIIGILVIIGWYTKNDFLTSGFDGQVKMKFNAAICFILSASVLLIKYFKRKGNIWTIISPSLSLLVFLIAVLTLAEYITLINFHIDELFVKEAAGSTGNNFAGRMSPITAGSFTLIGIGLILFNKEKSKYYQFFSLSFIIFVSILMLAGFNFVYDIPSFVRISFLTALGFISLASAIYFSQSVLRKKISFEFKLFTGLSAVIILIMTLGILLSYYKVKRGNSSQFLKNSNQILVETEDIVNLAENIENENELYISNGNNDHLKNLNNASTEIFQHLNNLKDLTSDNYSKKNAIEKLTGIVNEQINFTGKCIQTKKDLGYVAAGKLIDSRIGELNSSNIRSITEKIEQDEFKSFTEHEIENNSSNDAFNRIFFIFLGSVFVLLVFILLSIRKYITYRNSVEFEHRKIEIALKKTQGEIIELNTGLEKTVAIRTQEVLKSEKKYRYLFENNPMPMWIVDYYYNFLDVNLAAIESYGYSHEEFLSMTALDIRPDIDKKGFSKNYNKFAYKNHSSGIYQHVKKDGTVISVDIKVDSIMYNDISARLVLANDVTDRLKAEARIEQSESALKTAQAIAHLGSWDLDFATGKSVWSDECCRIYGLAVGKNDQSFDTWKSFIHPEDLSCVMKTISEGESKKSISSFTHRIIRKDGTIRYLFQDARYKINNENDIIGIYGITHDITERHLAELEKERLTADLLRRNKELEQFAYIISHNLRAPVANITGFAEELGSDSYSDEEKSLFLNELTSSVKNLDQVIIDLNDIMHSKQEINITKEKIFFSDTVQSIKASVIHLINKEKVEIITDFSDIEMITTVKSYIHSIFQNLIINSIKYKQPGKPPVIEINSEKKNGKIILLFKDNGRGINLERNGKSVFGLYKRFHKGIEGKGMGLYMVKSQVESLGGNIKIQSVPDEGTVFEIELPIINELEFSKVV